jgi:hypothetical protein
MKQPDLPVAADRDARDLPTINCTPLSSAKGFGQSGSTRNCGESLDYCAQAKGCGAIPAASECNVRL